MASGNNMDDDVFGNYSEMVSFLLVLSDTNILHRMKNE